MVARKEVKPLKYQKLDGLSEKQLSEHHGVLYTGYVKKWNEIQEKLETVDKSTPNATYSDLRELKLEETFAGNAIILHEMYFANLGGNGTPSGTILEWIKEDFGSFEKWAEEFKAMGICSRGWVVLGMDVQSSRLHNYLCDVHNQGGMWGTAPFLILDVYEHAYFIDYATGRKSYIEAFMKNINWDSVNNMIKQWHMDEMRKAMMVKR
ncbi:MAG: superoxide dismutase [Firmicutes bacterium]|nr:superoxide dismutase [Bacillota bacterium]